MPSPTALVRPAAPADIDAIARDLHEAFIEDPVIRWVFPDMAARRRQGRHYFALASRRLVPMGLSARTDGGAALWALPGEWRESALQGVTLAARSVRGVGWRRAPRVGRGLLGIEARHPAEPHVYLAAIGVRADARGGGIGSALMAPGLAHADAHGIPAYLESSNPRNVPLYERHGFVVTREVTLPGDGPVVTLMWRDPA